MNNSKTNYIGYPFRMRAVALATLLAMSGVSLNALAQEAGAKAETQTAQPAATTAAPPTAQAVTPGQVAIPSFSGIVDRVLPAVVSVKVRAERDSDMADMMDGMPLPDIFRFFFDGPGAPGHGSGRSGKNIVEGQGSGFVISPDGYIVTNNHVIADADEVTVVFNNDKKGLKAKVVGSDARTDLALLKIKTDKPLPYVELGDSSKARVGDWVLAVGNPFGLGGSVNAGILSARGRDIHSGPYDDYLQVDAPINRGNSGGPLFDTHGRVIGVNTAIYSPTGGSVGIGFAIPSEIVKTVTEQLKSKGHVTRGWLGVVIQPLTKELASGLGLKDAEGALIADIAKGGPAEKSGLKSGDVVVALNDKPITSSRDLQRKVANIQAGEKVKLDLFRDGKKTNITVTIGNMDEDAGLALGGGNSGPATSRLGMQLQALTPDTRRQYRIPEEVSGVLVTKVVPDSIADRAGIAPGSIINMVNGSKVSSPKDVARFVREAQSQDRESVIMRIDQSNGSFLVAVPLKDDK